MKVTVNVSKLVQQLKAFSQENEDRMMNMVNYAARELAAQASESTPQAPDDWAIRSWYVDTYNQRNKKFRIAEAPGFHKGAWVYSDQLPTNELATNQIRDVNEMLTDIQADMHTSFTLGEDFYISGTGPGFAGIEAGYSPQVPSIMQPTLDAVIQIYSMNLASYYQRG